MQLTETQKMKIKNFYEESIEGSGLEIEEAVEEILDFLLDEGHIDLSDDEDGDLYESYNNIVWEYVEEEIM